MLLVNRIYIELIIIIREGFIIFASAKVWTEFIRGVGLDLKCENFPSQQFTILNLKF